MRKIVILMAALALFGAGCGDDGDDGDGGATAAPTTTAAAATTPTTTGSPVPLPAGTPFHGTADAEDGMEVELDNFYFGPTVIEAKVGQAFKVELFNEGGAPHTFTIDSLSIDVRLDPDQKMEITVTAPSAAGTVEFYCRFHKASQAMQGALVVA